MLKLYLFEHYAWDMMFEQLILCIPKIDHDMTDQHTLLNHAIFTCTEMLRSFDMMKNKQI
jgi:hypothetical protein